MRREWRSSTRERLREVHHTREDLPDYVRQLLIDMGRHMAEQAAELQALRARVEQLENETEPLPAEDLPRFLAPAPAAPLPKPTEPAGPTDLDRQIRYELAVQALNGSAHAIDLMAPEAAGRGTTVHLLASQIITERRAGEARVAVQFAEQHKPGDYNGAMDGRRA